MQWAVKCTSVGCLRRAFDDQLPPRCRCCVVTEFLVSRHKFVSKRCVVLSDAVQLPENQRAVEAMRQSDHQPLSPTEHRPVGSSPMAAPSLLLAVDRAVRLLDALAREAAVTPVPQLPVTPHADRVPSGDRGASCDLLAGLCLFLERHAAHTQPMVYVCKGEELWGQRLSSSPPGPCVPDPSSHAFPSIIVPVASASTHTFPLSVPLPLHCRDGPRSPSTAALSHMHACVHPLHTPTAPNGRGL